MNAQPRAARFLELTLLASFVIHAVAIVSMGLMLVPGVPGGPAPTVEERAAYVASHPWLWRLGWVPWHLCAFIDVVTAAALLRTPWIPRLPAWLTLIITLCAVVPEQTGEIVWVTSGVGLARAAQDSPQALAEYAALEARSFRLAVEVGASLYLLMALGWTWCFAAAGTWTRRLTWLTPFTWGSLAVGSVGLLLPEPWRPGRLAVAVSNGLGFLLLEVWLWLVLEAVLARSRPEQRHGRLAPWRHPWRNPFGRLIEAVACSRGLRLGGELLPVPAFRSDIRDVVYVNYLLEAERLLPLVPEGLELQRLGPGGRFALLSILSYRHGHFGPAFLGWFRRLLPSPVQTNWRIYVRDPISGKRGVYFFTNAIASTVHALGARLLSEGMPMHVLAGAVVERREDGSLLVSLDPGAGTAPDLKGRFHPAEAELSGEWREAFESYEAFLGYTVTQDCALSAQPWYRRTTRQEIVLDIAPSVCRPVRGEVASSAASAITGGDAVPVCFHVPEVAFRFTGEECETR